MLRQVRMLGSDREHHDRPANRDDGDAMPFGPQHHAIGRFLRRVVHAIRVRPIVHGCAHRRPQTALRFDDGHAEIAGDDNRHGHPAKRSKPAG